jgi:predicted ABC-class ATPase
MKIESEFGATRVPNNVKNWTNLADGNDIVTVTGTLADDYAPSDTGVVLDDHRVVNDYRRPTGEANHHKSYGYLRTPEFSRIARGFLETGATEERS